MTEIGKRVSALRHEKGWTVEELSKKSGIDAVTIRRIERGDTKNPRLETLKKLEEVLGKIVIDTQEGGIGNELRLGFSHTVLAAPLIYVIATRSHYGFKLFSFGTNTEPRIFGAKQSLDAVDEEKFNRLREEPVSEVDDPEYTYSERELLNMLLGGDVDCVASAGATLDAHRSIMKAASITFGIRGVCKICMVGTKEKVNQLKKAIDQLKEVINQKKGPMEVKALKENTLKKLNQNDIFLFYMDENISSEMSRYYFQGVPFKRIWYKGARIYADIDKNDNFKELLENDEAFIIMYWQPQLTWIKQYVKKLNKEERYKDLTVEIAEPSEWFPKKVPVMSTFNLYINRNMAEEKYEQLNGMFDSIESAANELSEILKEDKIIEERTDSRRITHIAKYLGLDNPKTCAKILEKLDFQLMYHPDYLRHHPKLSK